MDPNIDPNTGDKPEAQCWTMANAQRLLSFLSCSSSSNFSYSCCLSLENDQSAVTEYLNANLRGNDLYTAVDGLYERTGVFLFCRRLRQEERLERSIGS